MTIKASYRLQQSDSCITFYELSTILDKTLPYSLETMKEVLVNFFCVPCHNNVSFIILITFSSMLLASAWFVKKKYNHHNMYINTCSGKFEHEAISHLLRRVK